MSEFKIKFNQELKVKKSDGREKTFVVRTKNDEEQTVKFKDDVKNGDKAEGQIDLEYQEKGKEGAKWMPHKSDVTYKETTFFKGVELTTKKLDGSSDELEKTIEPSIGFFKSMRWTAYAGFGALLFSVALLIWWWVSSSRSEDKEEEGL